MARVEPDIFGAEDSLIGRPLTNPDLPRLLRGRGRYVGDIVLPRMLHLVFVRSSRAHAKILSIDTAVARDMPGVAAVLLGAEIAAQCKPFVAVAQDREGHKSAPQYPIGLDRVVYQGQPVAAVVAASRTEAEDAAERITIEWDELAVLVRGEDALAPMAAPIHSELGDNLAYEQQIQSGDLAGAYAAAAAVVEHEFVFERQTGLTLEPRGLIADFSHADGTLTVYHSHQSPFQMQAIFAQHMDIAEHKVRVIAPDVGGGFGIKVNVYPEEIGVAVASRILGRPVKFCADRLESFLSDAHSRDHKIKARMALNSDGRITAMEVEDISSVGAYGMPLRVNIMEGNSVALLTGAPYEFSNYRARVRNAYVNKAPIGMYRGVGQPLVCAVTEVMADLAAARLGIDAVEFRRKNYRRNETLPCVTPGGAQLVACSFHACLDKLVEKMNYKALRAEQERLRQRGIYRGIGIATFCELTSHGPHRYGNAGMPISVQDGCNVRLEPLGSVRCITSTTNQGQGTLVGIAQIVASVLGVGLDEVDVIAGDSTISPYGGGAWASRGMTVGGEAALNAARILKANILDMAGLVHQLHPSELDLRGGSVVDRSGQPVMSLAEVASLGYFRPYVLPKGYAPQLTVSYTHVDNQHPYYMANGVQASYLELDPTTGVISLLDHWAVDDCGRVINPLLVDEQIRGGVVQGIGAVLYEECVYDDSGNLMNGTMADYIAPMAGEMPDICVAHVETITSATELGAKGVGEAGTIGAVGALWVAVNDALKPLGVTISHQPFTPERVLDALAKGVQSGRNAPRP